MKTEKDLTEARRAVTSAIHSLLHRYPGIDKMTHPYNPRYAILAGMSTALQWAAEHDLEMNALQQILDKGTER